MKTSSCSGTTSAILNRVISSINRDEIYSKVHCFIDSPFGTPAPEHFTLIEVGPSAAYDVVHIKKAIHMTLDDVLKRSKSCLPDHGAQIIVYGQNLESSEPRNALQILQTQGYGNLFYYPGGKADWMKAGLEVQYSLVPADHLGS